MLAPSPKEIRKSRGYSVIKQQIIQLDALEHWESNLVKAKAIKWKEWKQRSIAERKELVVEHKDDYPYIWTAQCAYCCSYQCYDCPLHDISVEHEAVGTCCHEWCNVNKAYITEPTTKEYLIKAIKGMIAKIKSVKIEE